MTRSTLMVTLLMGLLLTAGCVTNPDLDSEQTGMVTPGQAAADTFNSRALAYEDMINLIQGEIADLQERRESLLGDSKQYRARAAKAQFNKALGAAERKAFSEQYRVLAHQRQEQARNCTVLVSACQSRIAIWRNKATRSRINARRLEAIKVPEPR